MFSWVLGMSIVPCALASLYTSAADLTVSQWDYIVIGAGTAGSVVANRLSEDHSKRILVLESGGLDTGPDAAPVQVPFLVSASAPNTRFDYNYSTVPQASLDDRRLSYPRGHVIGGSSTINFMAFTRGSSQEYDRFAQVSGDPGWSWKGLWGYLLKNERHVESADGHDPTGQYTPQLHGNGPLLTSLPGNPTDLDQRILNTTSEFSQEFPFIEDMNGGKTLGIAWLQSTVGNSVRSSASTAFLTPAVNNRSNIDLLVNAHVSKLLNTGKNGRKSFTGVQFVDVATNTTHNVTASKEVILSAGSVGTPAILMLSGIGDTEELKAQGIEPAVDIPDVGKNLQDHLYVTLQWRVNSTSTFDTVTLNQTAFAEALGYYQQTGKGIMSNNAIANHIAFLRVPDETWASKGLTDPSAGGQTPHYEFAFCNGFVATEQTTPTSGNYLSVALVIVAPTARGSLKLSSTSPFSPPLIDPGFLSTDSDKLIAVEAVRSLKRFLNGTAWQGYTIEPYGDTAQLDTDEDIVGYWRKWGTSIRHPVSTAAISKRGEKTGVVNPDLTVKGVSGLRVVDASVLPYVPAAHPVAMIYAIGERAADLIKLSHLL